MSLINQIPFPAGFEMREIETNGATIHVRVGGHRGPAVVLLHGFGNTGDMWPPLAAALAPDHTVIVPDLRGLGLSSKPPGGYEKKTQARDLAGVMDALSTPRADLVTHDIGNMVGYPPRHRDSRPRRQRHARRDRPAHYSQADQWGWRRGVAQPFREALVIRQSAYPKG